MYNLKKLNDTLTEFILKSCSDLKHVQIFIVFNVSERISVKKGQVGNKRH